MDKVNKNNFNQDTYCDFCDRGVPLVIGKTDDYGIVIHHIKHNKWLYAYGYDVHGTGSNGLGCEIYFCPICGKDFTKESEEQNN